MTAVEEHFRRGVERFNRREFFEAHEEMEDAMNALEADTSDFDFYRGLLRAAVANHKLEQDETPSAVFHLNAALKFLAAYPDRHRGLKLREFRHALSVQLGRLTSPGAGSEALPQQDVAGRAEPPRLELLDAAQAPSEP